MSALSCRQVRIQLQALDELPLGEAGVLRAHLAVCPACRALASRQVEMDDAIRHALVAGNGISVAGDVRRRLEIARRTRRRGRRIGLRAIWPALAAAPLATAALIVTLLAPQILPRSDSPLLAGAAWHLVRPHVGYPLTVDATRPGHLLAGAFGQVYQTWNGGSSWQRLGTLPPHLVVQAVAVDVSIPRRYLVATKHSVYVSSDAGQSWTLAVDGLKGVQNMFLLQDTHHPSRFYLGPSVLWTSADHGATWYQDGKGDVFAPYGIQSLSVAAGGTLYTGIWDGGVALSRDAGRTWVRRSSGLDPHVLDVEAGSGGLLWAATPRGPFRSSDAGLHWQRVSLPGHLFTTSVLARDGYVLAGGQGALYRSTDGGHTWDLAMSGLPLDPYIYDLVADPRNAQRVYASLDGDGIFRSDDGGRTWASIGTGLPSTSVAVPSHMVLFRRGGVLWIADTNGAEPTALTVEEDVTRAAISPDGASVAYLARSGESWAVREMAAYGSAATTVAGGLGDPPRRLFWSPSSSILAIERHSSILLTDLTHLRSWRLTPRHQILGWSVGGAGLIAWNRLTGRLELHSWQTGGLLQRSVAIYPAAPIMSPGSGKFATIAGTKLEIGNWIGSPQPIATVPAHCRLVAWSHAATDLLARCHGRLIVVNRSGARSLSVPGQVASFTPSTSLAVLLFRDGSLWQVGPAGSTRKIVQDASPVSP